MGQENLLRFVKEGEQMSASQWNLVVSMLKGLINDLGPAFFTDATGHYKRRVFDGFPIVRAILDEDFVECGKATATVQGLKDDNNIDTPVNKGISLIDPSGVIPGHLLAELKNGVYVVPAGTSVLAIRMPDAEAQRLWEPLQFGIACLGSSSSGSESGSSGSGPSEGASGSSSGCVAGTLPPCPTDGKLYVLACQNGCPFWMATTSCGSSGS